MSLNRTAKSNGKSQIVLDPPEVRFENVLPGTLYAMTVSIRNASYSSQRIRLTLPKNSVFALNYVPSGPVAPGVEIRAEIECFIPEDLTYFNKENTNSKNSNSNSNSLLTNIFTDKILVQMGEYERLELPIFAFKPYPKLSFPNTITYGNILLNQFISKEFEIKNVSNLKAKVSLVLPSHSLLKLSHTKFVLEPQNFDSSKHSSNDSNSVSSSSIKIKMSLDAKQAGPIKEKLRILIDGAMEEEMITISSNIIQPSLTLLAPNLPNILNNNPRGLLDLVDFGKLFYGQSKKLEAKLVNGSPLPLNFSVKFEDEDATLGTEESGAIPKEILDARSIVVSPLDGVIKPFSEVTLTLSIKPECRIPSTGFIAQHLKEYQQERFITRKARIESNDTSTPMSSGSSGSSSSSQVIHFTLQAAASLPQLVVSPNPLRFGDCPVHDRRDILMTLTNPSELPVEFDFSSLANFKFSPSQGKILHLETVSVIATFSPSSLGTFKSLAHINLCKGLRVIDIKLIGESTDMGIRGHPAEFEEKRPDGKTITKTKNVSTRFVSGIDKLPHDFEPEYKFVDPEVEASARAEKLLKKEMDKMKLDSTIRNIINETSGKPTVQLVEALKMPKAEDDPMNQVDLPPIINAVKEKDDIYGTDKLFKSEKEREEEEMKKKKFLTREEELEHIRKEKDYEKVLKNKEVYNNYLQYSYTTRNVLKLAKKKKKLMETRGAIDFSDPFGVNLGMERDLDEPVLKIPRADEPLFMTNYYEKNGNNNNAKNMSGFGWDENKLIQKKFSSSPQTQAEMKDCSKELTIEELKSITSSHKVINFNKVCIGSTSVKNFVVFNPLKHAILVEIDDLDNELKGHSKGLKQIIPENSLAGFDIGLSCRNLGKFKSSFTWKINGLHSFKVQVQAEVTPILVEINEKELEYRFSPENLSSSLTQFIELYNPGNAPAEFLWGTVAGYTIVPDKGSVPAGKTLKIAITWDSLAPTKRNLKPVVPNGASSKDEDLIEEDYDEVEIGLLITNGIDQIVKIKSYLSRVKLELSEKKIPLGMMAVGTTQPATFSIKNIGRSPAVYFFQGLDDSFGIQATPATSSLPIGGVQEVSLFITPKQARNYDNTLVTFKVRGGKTLNLRLQGQSIVPDVEIIEESFKFGNVTVSSVNKLPLTIKNNSPILATLILDLNSPTPSVNPMLISALKNEKKSNSNPTTNSANATNPWGDFKLSLLNPLEKMDLISQEEGKVAFVQEDDDGNQIIHYDPSLEKEKDNENNDLVEIKKEKKRLKLLSSSSTARNTASASGEEDTLGIEDICTNKWKIYIPANTILKSELVFLPSFPRKYQFKLPLSLLGYSSPSSTEKLHKEVSAMSNNSMLSFSSRILDFNDKVVSRDPLSRVSYFLETTVTNKSSSGISFILEESEEIAMSFNGEKVSLVENIKNTNALGAPAPSVEIHEEEAPKIFFVSPLRVDLAPGASSKIRVTFLPQRSAQYHKFLSLFLIEPPDLSQTNNKSLKNKGDLSKAEVKKLSNKSYLKLLLLGSGVYPCMTFSTSSLRLPTVPLGLTSRAFFTIFNHGYASLTLNHRFSPSLPLNSIEISYPDGNELGIMVDKVRVCVSVRLEYAASWQGKVEFYDLDGERFALHLSGVTDNCYLSTAPFILTALNKKEFVYASLEEIPVSFIPSSFYQDLLAKEQQRKQDQRKQRSLERQKLVEMKSNGGLEESKKDPRSTSPKKNNTPKVRELPLYKNEVLLNYEDFINQDFLNQYVSYEESNNKEELLFALKFLNNISKSKKAFNIDNKTLEESIYDNNYESVIDCLEILCGRKMNLKENYSTNTNTKNSSGSSSGNSSNPALDPESKLRRASEKNKLINQADKKVQRLQQIINYLVSTGGNLLTHINPINLLDKPSFLLMSEYELLKEISSGSSVVTPSNIKKKKLLWHSQWNFLFINNWLEIFYQCIKNYLLVKINFNDFIKLPGMRLPSKYHEFIEKLKEKGVDLSSNSSLVNAVVKKGKNAIPPSALIPKDLNNSNIYTHGELLLLEWLTYHIENASVLGDDSNGKEEGSSSSVNYDSNSFNSLKIVNFDDNFKDFMPFCQILHSHVPELVNPHEFDESSDGSPSATSLNEAILSGYTSCDRNKPDILFNLLQDAMYSYSCSFPNLSSPYEVLISSRNKFLFLLHMYFLLPSLVPKTEINFSGELGVRINKVINIKNPTKKNLFYKIVLKDGSGESSGRNFQIVDKKLLREGINLLPEENFALKISLDASFLKKIHAKLYLFNLSSPLSASAFSSSPRSISSISSTTQSSPSIGVGNTLSFLLTSDINGIAPSHTENLSLSLYEFHTLNLPLTSPYHDVDGNYLINLSVKFRPLDINSLISPNLNKTLMKQLSKYYNKKKRALLNFQPVPYSKEDVLDEDEEYNDENKKKSNEEDDPTFFLQDINKKIKTCSGQKGIGSKINSIPLDDWEIENLLYQPFWISEEGLTPNATNSSTSTSTQLNNKINNTNLTVNLLKGQNKQLKLFILPFVLGDYICEIKFYDSNIGEFSYRINVSVGLPKAQEKLDIGVVQGDLTRLALTLNSKNIFFEKSANILTDSRIKNANKKIKVRQILQQFMSTSSPLLDDKFLSKLNNNQNKRDREVATSFSDSYQYNYSSFIVDFSSPFFQYKRYFDFLSDYSRLSNVNASKAKKVNKSLLEVVNVHPQTDTLLSSKSNMPAPPLNKIDGSISLEESKDQTETGLLASAPPQPISVPNLNSIFIDFQPDKAGIYKTYAVVYPNNMYNNPDGGELGEISEGLDSSPSIYNHFIHDIRVVELNLYAKVPDANMTLEFKAPARKKISQTITITNDSSTDWNLNLNLIDGQRKNGGNNYVPFSYPKTLFVHSFNKETFQIDFFAYSEGIYEGKLQLRNRDNSDLFEYILKGNVEEPLAESSLNFQAVSRSRTNLSVDVPNLYKLFGFNKLDEEEQASLPSQLDLNVLTDLPFITCSENLKVNPNKPFSFPFSIYSPMGGILSGYIGFQDVHSKAEVWFSISVDVSAPREEKTIHVSSVVRQACVIEITLDNPLDEEIVFDVALLGNGLLGEEKFKLLPVSQNNTSNNPNSRGGINSAASSKFNTYELIYSPLQVENTIGRISFFNEIVGEVWYKLHLEALPALPIELDLIETMLGCDGDIIASVENPLGHTVSFSLSVDDSLHFLIPNNKLVLAPFMQTQFVVKFRPTSLGEEVSTLLHLYSEDLGEILYNLRGKGLLPGLMPSITIESPLDTIVSKSIVFRNPFPHPLPIETLLEIHSTPMIEEEKKDKNSLPRQPIFQLLSRKSNQIVLQPKATYHITVGFTPPSLGIYQAMVQIRAAFSAFNFLWCYPIQGIAQIGQVQRLTSISIPAKTCHCGEEIIALHGIPSNFSKDLLKISDFTIEFKTDESVTSLVSRTFHFQPIEIIEMSNTSVNSFLSNDAHYGLRCRVLFEPLREFNAEVEISLNSMKWGKWISLIHLNSSPPPVDDTISLVASVGSSDAIKFNLCNRFLVPSTFQAFFSSGSSPHFSVTPTRGVLPPHNQGLDSETLANYGTGFVVTYQPKEYGILEQAILNILTEDAQWSYLVKGSYPEGPLNVSSVHSKIISRR